MKLRSNRPAFSLRRIGRLLALAGALGFLPATPLAAQASAKKLTAGNWDASAQRLVVRDGLMAEGGSGFGGAANLTAGAERAALGELATRLGVAPITVQNGASLSVADFDALLVDQLGLATSPRTSSRSRGGRPASARHTSAQR